MIAPVLGARMPPRTLYQETDLLVKPQHQRKIGAKFGAIFESFLDPFGITQPLAARRQTSNDPPAPALPARTGMLVIKKQRGTDWHCQPFPVLHPASPSPSLLPL